MASWSWAGTGDWATAGNWLLFTPPNASTEAIISIGNVNVTTTGRAALYVFLSGSKTVDVSGIGQLAVGGLFDIGSGSNLVVRTGGSVSAGGYAVAGKLVVGGATAAEASGAVSGNIAVSSGGEVVFNTNNSFTFSNIISGAGGVEQKGAGTIVTLTGNNTYTGLTEITAGTLRIDTSTTGPFAGGFAIASGGVLDLYGWTNRTIGALSGAGTVTSGDAGFVTSFIINSAASATFSGVIENGVGPVTSFTKSGTGTQTLSGANTYTGTTTVSGGTLQIQNALALGATAGGTTVAAGAALAIAGGITVGAEALTLNGTGIADGGALRHISGFNTWDGTITLGSAARINADSGTFHLNGTINNGGHLLTVGGAGETTALGVISGAGGLTKDGAGIFDLRGSNTYTGTTTINSGVIIIGGGTGLADGARVTVNVGGNYQLNSDDTIGSLEGSGSVFLNGKNLTTGGDNSSSTFSGVIGGTGNFTTAGSGTQTLSGANTYTGTTTVSGGTLRIENGSALGTTEGGTTVEAGAALAIAGGIAVGAEALTLNGSGIADGGALRNISGNNIWNGPITLGSAARINSDAGFLNLNGAINNGGHLLTVGGAGDIRANNVISGTGGLTKDGAGAFDLRGSNTFTGSTTVNGGTVLIVDGTGLADGARVTVNTGGYYQLNFHDTIGSLEGSGGVILNGRQLTMGGDNSSSTFSGVIDGTGDLTKSGTGTMTLSGANTYAGTTTVSGGTLRIENASALGTTAGSTTVAAGAALAIAGDITVGAEALTLNGSGIADGGALRNISSLNTWGGAITLDSAARINSDAGPLFLNGTINNQGHLLTIGGAGTIASTNVISGTGGLTKDGAGNVSLAGANTFTGAVNVNAGTLQLLGGAALADSVAVTVASGATLQVFASETIGSLSGAGSVSLSGSTTLTTGGNNASTTFSGGISEFGDTSGLTKTGTGTMTLSGANTYTGTTTVSAGTLRIENGAALGTTAGGTTVEAGAALAIAGGIDFGAEALTLNEAGIANGGALRNISGNNIWFGAITLGSAARINSDADKLDLLDTVNNGGHLLTVGGAGGSLFVGVISGTGGLTKDGAGIMGLMGTNTFTGAVTVSAGTLQIRNGAALADSVAVTVASGAVLDLISSETIGSLTGAGTVNLLDGGTKTLTTGGNNASTTFSGVISEQATTGNLTKTGTGTMTLSGANTYTGTTTVSGGTLRIENGSALGTTAGGTTVEAGAVLAIASGIDIDVGAEALTLNGSGIADGGALRNISSWNTWAGAIMLGSAVRINADAGRLDLNGTINNGGHLLTIGGAGIIAAGNVISGSGGLTKDGAGVSALFGVNTFTGAVNVNAGNLQLTGGSALADSVSVTVASGALVVANDSETIGSLSGAGNFVLDSASNTALTAGGNNTSTTFSGVMSQSGGGSGTLVKTGTGTMTLSGANTYTGVTTVSGGTLALAGDGSIANSNRVEFSSSAVTTFDISGVTGAGASIRDLEFAAGSNGTINLVGKTLNVTHADGSFGTGTINGGVGNDRLNITMAGPATTVSLAGLSFNTWTDGTDAVLITGNALANTITGSTKADTIDGGAGDDTINGGGGNDTFKDGAGADSLTGGEGFDILDASAGTGALGVYADLVNGFMADRTGAYDDFTGIEMVIGTNNFISGVLSDIMLGDANGNYFYGLGGQDYIVGEGGADYIDVGTGADNIGLGGEGDDTLIGGVDADFLFGNGGSDSLTGDGGDDWLFTGDFSGAAITGADTAVGGAGNDVIAVGDRGGRLAMGDGGIGNDTIYGGASANDLIRGGTGSDYVFGDTGADTYRFETGDLVAGDVDTVFTFNAGDRLSFATAFSGQIGAVAGTNGGINGVYLTHTGSSWIAWLPYQTVANVQGGMLIFE
ncbi:MAG: beta strand repeat-containing protein [Beijerinckiaceae bacterium]